MLSIMKNKKILCSVCFLFAFVSVLLTSSLKKPQYYNWLINNIL